MYQILLRDTETGDTAPMNIGCAEYLGAMIDWSELTGDGKRGPVEILGYREISFEEAKPVAGDRTPEQERIVKMFAESFFAWFNAQKPLLH